MGTIVAIGGGEISNRTTLHIDREIVKLTKKKEPRVLFIPTASGDEESYWESFNSTYRDLLKCQTDILRLVVETPTIETMRDKIFQSDIVYVGGGDTQRMLAVWKEKGVDSLLLEAFQKGIILSGISAGANCWFEKGVRFAQYNSDNQPLYEAIDGLGIVDGMFCPHFNEDSRAKQYLEMLASKEIYGFALEDNAALFIKKTEMHIVISNEGAKGYQHNFKNKLLQTKEF